MHLHFLPTSSSFFPSLFFCSMETVNPLMYFPVGPLSNTVVDFWRLVWQLRPPSIVMVTNLKEGSRVKCEQYWPELGTQEYGPFKVTLTDQQVFADYTIRQLFVSVSSVVVSCLEMSSVGFRSHVGRASEEGALKMLM